MDMYSRKQKMMDFIRKYGYYFLLGLAILSIVTTLLIVAFTSGNGNTIVDESIDGNSQDVSSNSMTYMPVLNAKIYKGFSQDELVFNETLKQWETHNGIDFQVANGSAVYSIRDGVVKNVFSNVLDGMVVVVEHSDGLVSTYSSLGDDVSVKTGDMVKGGQQIGSVSSSSNSEADAGAHLHFSMTDNGKKVDPASYLDIDVK